MKKIVKTVKMPVKKSAAKNAAAKKAVSKAVAKKSAGEAVLLMVGTRKGTLIYRSDAARTKWKHGGMIKLGTQANHVVLDPRNGKTMLMGAKDGHLGPTVFRSTDLGKTWVESEKPPAFPKSDDPKARAVQMVFWLTPGHASEPGVWYAGTSPQALFRSEDDGRTWAGLDAFNDLEILRLWTADYAPTPGGPILHSIIVSPDDANHLYVGLSCGGIFESTDRGATWTPLNKGVQLLFAEQNSEYGHDPHCLAQHPVKTTRLYHQNHCGIYRLDRPGTKWVRIGKAMPKEIGDIGFPIVLDPRDPDVAYVFPMDGRAVWPRTSIDGKPAVYRTRDAGKSWERLAKGLPKSDAWWTVKRQAMCGDHATPQGLYFGTTSGELWGSADAGKSWTPIAAHLPEILSVTVAPLG